jgi:hypothetical protein
MKQFVAFLLILISNPFQGIFACGPYYPFGDDIRFTILKSGTFYYPGYIEFSYSADLFYSPKNNHDYSATPDTIDSNIELWLKRCKYIPDYYDAYNAIYILGDEINNPNFTNSFIRYLHEHNDSEAIKYLNFAKKCSVYNAIIDDPWERKESANIPKRMQLINQALNMAKTLTDDDLKCRYAFLAIRLAYYNDDRNIITNTYIQFFSNRKTKNIIDYWSMYFMTFTETDTIKRNYFTSQVFYFAPDKRVNIFQFYNRNVPLEKTLLLAKTSEEKIAVLMMDGFRKSGKSIEVLKTLYSLKPDLQGLSFLLLREVNKLEDWIYTPYYTNFRPSLEQFDYYWSRDQSPYPKNRIKDDRAYAENLLNFVNSVNIRKVENPELWSIVRSYLNYMTRKYETALNEIDALQPIIVNDPKLSRVLNMMKALCITAKQGDNAVIKDEIKPVIMQEYNAANNKFIFALARELEFRGNTTEAAILLSKLKTRVDKQYEEGYWRNGIYWRTDRNHYTLYVDYYDDYFFYLDAQYSTIQLNDLVADIKNKKDKNDTFSVWEYSVIKKDIPRLYDLIGTKYLRKNDLPSALKNFEEVNDTLWISHYFPYQTYLDANPFYTNMFNEHSKTNADTTSYNKASLTRKLIEQLSKANDPGNKDRDYYFFLAANCYLNMTQYGNSWIMKRYFWTANIHKTQLEDDEDYFNCTLAKEYYLKAGNASKSKMFAALCLRMAGRCENYRIINSTDRYQTEEKLPENSYYNNLHRKFPAYYAELMGNCQSFEKYFNSRN